MSVQNDLYELNIYFQTLRESGRRFFPISENDDPYIGGVVVHPAWPLGGNGFMCENETFSDTDANAVAKTLNIIRDYGPAIAELIESEVHRQNVCAEWDKGQCTVERMSDAENRSVAALAKLVKLPE
jgi:hypothetical protein